jgi:hypothetical protein
LDATVRVLDTGFGFYEPALGITKSGTMAVCCVSTGDDPTGTASSTIVSRDGGQTWAVAHTQPILSFDPMLATDPVTERIYELNMLAVACSNLAYSDDQGATWTERPASCGALPVYDFLKLAAGLPGPEPNPLAGAAYPSVLYQCRNVNAPFGASVVLSNWCTVSYDGGLTWPVDEPVAVRGAYVMGQQVVPGQGCGAVTGFPTVGPDGTAAVPIGNGCPTIYVAISRDSGLTWTLVRGPGDGGLLSATPEVEFDAAGHLYAMWQDYESHMVLARSDDLGATWHGPWSVMPPGVGSVAFEAMEAGAEGRLALSFLGTDEPVGEDTGDVSQSARWHLYVVTVEDGQTDAPAIAAYRATPPEDPDQVGPVCFGGSGCLRNLGDFLTADQTASGGFVVAYADGCTSGCAGKADATNDDASAGAGRIALLEGFSLR